MMNEIITIQVEDSPPVPVLRFRRFRGEIDYSSMLDVLLASSAADGQERVDTMEAVRNTYEHLTNCDPYEDMIMAEINGELVAYGRAFWWKELDGPYRYISLCFLDPKARRQGIGRVMLQWLEERHHHSAQQHPPGSPKDHIIWGELASEGLAALAAEAGYKPIRYAYDMVRPSLEDIPDFPLPEGIELRPVTPDQYRAIWDANQEAFRDHWGYAEPTEDDYQHWLNDKTVFQPERWQIGWDIATNEIAGQVRTFINEAQNEKFGRKRGYTEFISVRRPWRRRGLARALIAESLRVQKGVGMTESALAVDSESLTGATRVYEDCGFRTVKTAVTYARPLMLEP